MLTKQQQRFMGIVKMNFSCGHIRVSNLPEVFLKPAWDKFCLDHESYPGSPHKSTAIYLQPGEKIKLDASRKTLIRSKISPDLYSAWTQGKWNFHQTSLQDITGLLKEYYGVETVFNNERSRHLRINAVMAVSSLYKLIPVIEQTLQIKIEILNDRLIVQ